MKWRYEKWGYSIWIFELGVWFIFVNICNKLELLLIWFNVKINYSIEDKIINFEVKLFWFEFWIFNIWLCD